MTEKIEWYKEVLELEPNSKVFFPLARLLSEAGRADEAVEILEQGLARHEEFLEARLFLIELLHTANRLEACEKQVGRLTKMFSTYAGFWQAWAACINAAGDAPDTAAVLRFLALNFSKGPVSLHEVINQGLASLSGAGAAAGARSSLQARSEAAIPAAGPSAHEAAFATASTSAHQAVTEAAAPVAEAAEQLVAAPVLATAMHDADAQLDADVHINDVDAHDPIDFDPDLAMADDEALPAELEDGTPSMLARGADAYAAYAAPVTQSEAVVVDDADEGEERFSLRTRSMAEVLAEQGDIKGALDIYHELAAAAVHPEESADLRQRITTLTARLGNAQTVDPVQPAATAEHASGKDKLISMLEALAERVEARAHS
ncbi:tetratricopeptide repeat protein [Desulfovibrio desulfuricans]|uniref:tetratricopeptide repeat protein n=1 Tax=Desulfovibrio desulfuricans TaxID=876 RepID=UPI001AE7FFE7|nr:tetratricopeptide repeat protein [Desulfovibrio desulfuricans]MDD3683503.1 tetratricopeptide repeat protein [Desulfovibrio desulfuricans]QTO39189.1 tetratricopeptide repeat protein [Desulfovibrio desulfuricans]